MSILIRRLFAFALFLILAATAVSAEEPAKPATTVAPAPVSSQDTAKMLLGVLKDDAARAAFVQSLEAIAAGKAGASVSGTAPAATEAAPATDAAPATPAAGAAAPAVPKVPLAREIGSVTQELTRSAIDVATKVWYGLGNLRRLIDGSVEINWDNVRDQGQQLLVLVVFAFAMLTIVRRLVSYPLRALGRLATDKSGFARLPWVLLAFVADVLTVGVAWFLSSAYAIAASSTGHLEMFPSLFIDAFALVETLKAIITALFRGRQPALRLLPISIIEGRFWSRWLSLIVGFLGYGVMIVHPTVNQIIGFSFGIGFRLAIVLIALIAAIAVVLHKSDDVRRDLSQAIERVRMGSARAVLALLVHAWHLLVITYLLVAFVLWVSRPFDAVDFMARATFESLIAIVVGGVAASLLSRAIASGIRLPKDVTNALPLLEQRLNLFIPMLLGILRMLILLAVTLGLLQSWSLIDLASWLESARGADLLGRVASAFLILMMAIGLWLVASSWIEYRLRPSVGRLSNARTRTLLSLFRNAFSIVLVVISSMLVLSQLGVDIAPLIAGAGVVGLAVGFGSQKLVQDIITGVFIQFENAMNEGDVVTVAGLTGVVDRLTIRSVGLRDADGVYHIIPFSSVSSVSNAMRGFAFHVANVDVAYKEDLGEVKRCLGLAFDRLVASESGAVVLEPLDFQGIVHFGPNSVTVRARIKTLPGEQWATGRTFSALIKDVFQENGIEMALNQTKVWLVGGNPDDAIEQPQRGPTAPPRQGPGRPRRPAETLDFDEKDEEDGDDGELR